MKGDADSKNPRGAGIAAGPAGSNSSDGHDGKGTSEGLVRLPLVTRHSRLGDRAVTMGTAFGPPAQPLCYSSSPASTVVVAPFGAALNIRFSGSV